MEKTGAVFLFQELQPTKLIGSAVPFVDAIGNAWIRLGFFQAPGSFELFQDEKPIRLLASRAIAQGFVSVMELTIAQLEFLREPTALLSERPSTDEFAVTVGRDLVACSWATTEIVVSIAAADAQVELKISEAAARTLTFSLVRELGRFAAVGAWQ